MLDGDILKSVCKASVYFLRTEYQHQFQLEGMSECLIEKCQVNVTQHWDQEIPNKSLAIFDIFFWTCDAVIIIFGIPVNIGIIHYEWYGGDPQKRSLSNRMMSSGVIAQCTAGVLLHTFSGMMRLVLISNL